jgi:hypothetical protein
VDGCLWIYSMGVVSSPGATQNSQIGVVRILCILIFLGFRSYVTIKSKRIGDVCFNAVHRARSSLASAPNAAFVQFGDMCGLALGTRPYRWAVSLLRRPLCLAYACGPTHRSSLTTLRRATTFNSSSSPTRRTHGQ